ncbi:1,4-alpha-glucan branching enzyme [Labilithrix luteola]|uniref:1,4-alpha-glucan branching enzyme n=1 Tax=Labilithrix luteola TaxID=1391654 RepID=A0A0K1PN86_9BACT|nr:hypothetical protein [Labilithrix luteola]AKU94977.1 1,4-alpha-glucan branching enzyme [Labilithrix luteola]
MATAAKTTTDHDVIRRWVEARGGAPAHVKGTGRRRNDPGVLRIDYEGFSGAETLEEIGWDTWFDAFDRKHLAFLYQPRGQSRFSKLIERETETAESRTTRTGSSTKAKSAGSRKGTAALATVDHDVIRQWVEARGGCPAHVKATGRRRNDPGILRIDYPEFSGQKTLEEMEWDDWFQAFDRHHLAFLYQPKEESRFSKLVDRDTVEGKLESPRGRSSTKASAAPTRKPTSRAASRRGSLSSRGSRA